MAPPTINRQNNGGPPSLLLAAPPSSRGARQQQVSKQVKELTKLLDGGPNTKKKKKFAPPPSRVVVARLGQPQQHPTRSVVQNASRNSSSSIPLQRRKSAATDVFGTLLNNTATTTITCSSALLLASKPPPKIRQRRREDELITQQRTKKKRKVGRCDGDHSKDTEDNRKNHSRVVVGEKRTSSPPDDDGGSSAAFRTWRLPPNNASKKRSRVTTNRLEETFARRRPAQPAANVVVLPPPPQSSLVNEDDTISQKQTPEIHGKPRRLLDDGTVEDPFASGVQATGGSVVQCQSADEQKIPVFRLASMESFAAPATTESTASDERPAKKKKTRQQENFVRLNLRNKGGACRNKAKPTSSRSKNSHTAATMMDDDNNKNRRGDGPTTMYDPVDDFVDGVFSAPNNDKSKHRSDAIPLCSGHRQPCKLLTVKKSGPNKGRKFYACAGERREQCNHFAWADDTVEAAQKALLKNSSLSGFIARQVASYMSNIKCLTVPELRTLAKRHGLDSTGKKAQLLMRLSIWVRDEIARGTYESADNGSATKTKNGKEPLRNERAIMDTEGDDDCSSDDNDDDDGDDESSSSSEEELELFGDVPSRPLLGAPVESKVYDHDGQQNDLRSERSRCKRKRAEEDSLEDALVHSEEEKFKEKENSGGKPKDKHYFLKKLFGHSSFREGQEWAVDRCLRGERSLLVAPTGSGKSLCFALPAALMEGVCVVVSPLLSLIQDQLRLLPARLPAVTLSGSMSTATMASVLDDIIRGRIKILFVSPERLTSASFRRLFRPKWDPDRNNYTRMFPPVSLLCVDEAHCLSQWAHNFRPSYLRLRSMLEMIRPASVLGITATAGPRVVGDICRALRIQNDASIGEGVDSRETSGVRVMATNRDNIDVSCFVLESQEERLSMLMKVLTKKKNSQKMDERGTRVDGCLATGSVIVYVWRQRDAEVVAENIRAAGISGGVAVYHGGMNSVDRNKAQSRFMRGKVRICVATIAFGLGLNKADVAGVIHLYLSSSPEHYIQEIGRAGRDGRPARAVALVLRDEVLVRHSLAHSDMISKSQVKTLLSSLDTLVKDSISSLPKSRSKCQPVSVAFPLFAFGMGCDCKAETVETLISFLESRDGGEPLLSIEGTFCDRAVVAPKRRTLGALAEKEPAALAILRCATCTEPPAGESGPHNDARVEDGSGHRLIGHSFGSYAFSVAQCSNSLGAAAEPRHVFAALRRLESNGEIELVLDSAPNSRSLNLRLTNAGLQFFAVGSKGSLETLVDEVLGRSRAALHSCANKVIDINFIIRQVSEAALCEGNETRPGTSSSLILFQSLVGRYFEEEGNGVTLASELPMFADKFSTEELSMDSQTILLYLLGVQGSMPGTRKLRLGDPGARDYTALMITKFFHGIAPASLPPSVVRHHHLFGKMQAVRFPVLLDAVTSLFEGKGS